MRGSPRIRTARACLLAALALLLALSGCGRKAKPEPLWGALRVPSIPYGTR